MADSSQFNRIPYSPGPTFIPPTNRNIVVFAMTLTGDVTSCSIAPLVPGQIVVFILTQDATGGHLFQFPATVQNPPQVSTASNAVNTSAYMTMDDNSLFPITLPESY